jgi:hypothetical protein
MWLFGSESRINAARRHYLNRQINRLHLENRDERLSKRAKEQSAIWRLRNAAIHSTKLELLCGGAAHSVRESLSDSVFGEQALSQVHERHRQRIFRLLGACLKNQDSHAVSFGLKGCGDVTLGVWERGKCSNKSFKPHLGVMKRPT